MEEALKNCLFHSNEEYAKFVYHSECQFDGINIHGKKILDIGCGKGLTSIWLSQVKNAGYVIALDEFEGEGAERENFDFIKKIVLDFSINNVEIVKSDFLKNSFPESTFDIIVANYSFHHVIRTNRYISSDIKTEKQWISLFQETRRILKDDGILVIKEVTRSNLWRFIPLRYKHMDWEIHPTITEFVYVMRKAGFKNIVVRNVVNYSFRKFQKLFIRNFLFSFFISPDFYVLARNA